MYNYISTASGDSVFESRVVLPTKAGNNLRDFTKICREIKLREVRTEIQPGGAREEAWADATVTW